MSPPFYYGFISQLPHTPVVTGSAGIEPWTFSNTLIWLDFDDPTRTTSTTTFSSITDRANGYVFSTNLSTLPTVDTSSLPGHTASRGQSATSGLYTTNITLRDAINASTEFTYAAYTRHDTNPNQLSEPAIRVSSGSALQNIESCVQRNTSIEFNQGSGSITWNSSTSDAPDADNGWHSWVFTWDVATGAVTASYDGQIFLSGTKADTGGLVSAGFVATCCRNTGSYLVINAMWNRRLTDTEVAQVHTYMNDRFG